MRCVSVVADSITASSISTASECSTHNVHHQLCLLPPHVQNPSKQQDEAEDDGQAERNLPLVKYTYCVFGLCNYAVLFLRLYMSSHIFERNL